MRRLLPLIVVLAFAIGAVDDAAVARKWRPGGRSPSDGGRDRTAPDDRTAWQRGTFDAATGTLTWFDDVYN